MRFEVIDNCPVPTNLAPAIRAIKRRSGAELVSCDRSPEAEPLLRKLGKQSQRQLYNGFRAGLPGYNPANPPGFSTHERRSDGVAYRIRRGWPLRYWQVGMDWSNAAAVVREAKAEGFTATVTYPTNPRELHHVNFRKEPRVRLPLRPLKAGSQGDRVEKLTRRLMIAKDPHTGEPYLDQPARTFTPRIEAAVKNFQRDHHQKPDGVVGTQTQRQLMASVRFQIHKSKG